MSDFDPKKFLADTAPAEPKGFDPKAFLTATAPKDPGLLEKAKGLLEGPLAAIRANVSVKRGFGDVNWGQALADEVTKPIPEGAMVIDNPALNAVAGTAATGGILRRAAGLAKEAIPIAIGAVGDEAIKKFTGENSFLGKELGTALAIARKVSKVKK